MTAPEPQDLSDFDLGYVPAAEPEPVDEDQADEPDEPAGSGRFARARRSVARAKVPTVDSVAGAVWGFIIYALANAYIDGGQAEVNRWLRAKLTNNASTSKPASKPPKFVAPGPLNRPKIQLPAGG